MILKKSPLKAVCLSIVTLIIVSCVWGAFVLGPKPFDFFDTNWLWHDLAQVYLAWAQYTSDPNSHWLMSSRMSYPLELNFALFDPMPIFLLTAGKLSPFLPDRTQYFGIYFLLCLIFQGIFGYLILKKITVSIKASIIQIELYCLFGSIFFIVAPYTFYRFQQHTALASHWIILLSIWTSLCSRSSNLCRWTLLNGLIVLLATGINPYLTLMVLISQSCLVIFDFYKTSYRQIIFRVFGLAIFAVAGFKIFGFISASGVRDFGYGVFSMNMLGPVNPNGLAKLFQIHISDPTGGQAWEGFNYQGLGILILLSICLFLYLRRKPLEECPFPYRPALLIVFISYLLALSTTLTLASIKFKPYVPYIIDYVLSAFRASGRFFWLGGFWLILIGLATLVSYIKIKKCIFVLISLLLIQIIDVSGIAIDVRKKISTIQRASINDEDIMFTPQPLDELVVLPPWQCNTEKTAGGGNNYEYLGFFAADQKINTNNFYAARILPEQTAYHCSTKMSQPDLVKNKIYIISEDFLKKMDQQKIQGLNCSYNSKHFFYICTVS